MRRAPRIPRPASAALLALALALGRLGLAPPASAADLHVWVDEDGVTHLSDDPESSPPGAETDDGVDGLRALWDDGGVLGEPLLPEPGATSSEADRQLRALRSAMDDLRRGETGRARAALRRVLEVDPSRPEAHFVLALLEGRSGHWDSAEVHLRAFLASAGDRFAPWRASAERRLRELADERRLLDDPSAEALRLVNLEQPDFRVQADAALVASGGADFARTVTRYLHDVRGLAGAELGAVPAEPLGVVLYGRSSYQRAYGHRFSFRTVGFFDGRIHVVSAAHPAGELRTLLVHEYTHALFREQTGGDRPFWLNEGLAEWMERASQQRPIVARGERSELRAAIQAGRWLSLRRLAPSFSGLDDSQARLAYTISTAAADWLRRHTEPAQRAKLLKRLGQGWSDDDALREAVGHDTAGVDQALREEVLARFPVPARPRSEEP